MKAFITLLCFLAWANLSPAQTTNFHSDYFRTFDGQSFTNADVRKLNAVFALVSFDAGGAKVALTNLPSEIREALGFNPEAANQFLGQQRSRSVAIVESQRRARHAAMEARKERTMRYVGTQLVDIDDFQTINAKIELVLTNGIICRPLIKKVLPPVLPPSYMQSIGASPIIGHPAEHEVEVDKIIFILCPSFGLAEGQRWTGTAVPCGTFTYRSSFEAESTLEQYDVGRPYVRTD